MVPGNVDDACSLARLFQERLHHLIVAAGPIPGSPQLPVIHDIADKIEILGLCASQEIKEIVGLAAARVEMNVRDPDGAKALSGNDAVHLHPSLR